MTLGSIWRIYIMFKHYTVGGKFDADTLKGSITGLYGRIPPDLQRLVRKIMDSPSMDYGAMELLDVFQIEWRDENKP
jgi:hypothetical protein